MRYSCSEVHCPAACNGLTECIKIKVCPAKAKELAEKEKEKK